MVARANITRSERRLRSSTHEDDQRRIVALLSGSRVWMTSREVAAIIWGTGTPPQRAGYHLLVLQRQRRVKRLGSRWKA